MEGVQGGVHADNTSSPSLPTPLGSLAVSNLPASPSLAPCHCPTQHPVVSSRVRSANLPFPCAGLPEAGTVLARMGRGGGRGFSQVISCWKLGGDLSLERRVDLFVGWRVDGVLSGSPKD